MTKHLKCAFYVTMVFIWTLVGILAFKSNYGKTVANAEEPYTPEYYPAAGIVRGFSEKDNVVFVKTNDGRVWSFYGIEDWEVGDICLMVMHDDGVRGYIDDDSIISVRYYRP